MQKGEVGGWLGFISSLKQHAFIGCAQSIGAESDGPSEYLNPQIVQLNPVRNPFQDRCIGSFACSRRRFVTLVWIRAMRRPGFDDNGYAALPRH
jgi:hypothetical protein